MDIIYNSNFAVQISIPALQYFFSLQNTNMVVLRLAERQVTFCVISVGLPAHTGFVRNSRHAAPQVVGVVAGPFREAFVGQTLGSVQICCIKYSIDI